MYKAIFQILKVENSLDSVMSSYELLLELDKCFPRVYLFENSESSLSSSPLRNQLVVVEEAWSPFSFGPDVSSSEKQDHDKVGGSLDATAFHLLIEDLGDVADEANTKILDSKPLRNMLQFQYLVNVLEGDFVPRNLAFKESLDWISLRESFLNMILVSRKIVYKGLIKDCVSTICKLSQFSTDCVHDVRSAEVTEKCHTALAIALPEIVKCTCLALQKLLFMIIELDSSKKAADMEGQTTRADGVRTPAIEIILDELTYDKYILIPFLEALNEPRIKLDMIIQYLKKYIPKTSVRTRRSNDATNDSTFGGILKCFSNGNITKSITKKISTEVAQLLLAHAFQAYISLPTESKEDIGGNTLEEICISMISAFTCLKKTDEQRGIVGIGKEAVLTAAIMLS